jgi:predicted nucleic acid-binding protein
MIALLPWLPNPNGTPTFVLDPGVTVAWRVPLSGTTYPSTVLGRMTRAIAAVPECWLLDIAERVRACVRKKQLSLPQANQFFTDIQSFAIWVDDETPLRAWEDTFQLARKHKLATGIAAYLELALRINLPFATIDATLLRAASAAGVSVFTP